MNPGTLRPQLPGVVLLLLAGSFWTDFSAAQCTLSVATRKFEGAERTIVTMENPRILVEVVPELEGRISRYVDKSKSSTAFEWLDDCPYHYGGRWEGKPFTHRIQSKGPQRAAVTVIGGGKVSVGLLRGLLGVNLSSPLDLAIERTMSIEADSTRLRMDVKITNTGEGIAPTFRYMVHAVYGQVPPMAGGRAFWFLPTAGGVEFFDQVRGGKEMGASAGSGGAPLDHPFSRFLPGRKADKPRYEAQGWGAALTSAGPTFIYYDPKEFDFMQYWFGGDAQWHLTFEPHTRPVDLKPGESVTCSFTLAYDSADVPFNTPTVAYERPTVPEVVLQGGNLKLQARATTVQNKPEQVRAVLEVKDPKGQPLLSANVGGELQPFAFTELSAEARIPEGAALGAYAWKMLAGDGRELASGKFEVVTAEELTKRQMALATAELRGKLDELNKKYQEKDRDFRKLTELWRDGANLALRLSDRDVWPETPPAGAILGYRRGAVAVLGRWREKESPRVKTLAPAPIPAWPANAEALLALLKNERLRVRDVAPDGLGTGLLALVVDAAKKRADIVHLTDRGIARRFGRFAEKPGENDATLGAEARAIAVDADGQVWVATNAWGPTSVFKRGADGAPFEESVIDAKGALKKFSAEGRLSGTVSLLDAPMDLALALADGVPVVLATYRNVSEYHGAQVREGIMIVRTGDAMRIGEIKAPAGSVGVDESGRMWVADVAGHIGCYDLRGRKQFDVADSPAPAVADARLPANSPLPVVVRADGRGSVWALFTLARKLVAMDVKGAPRGAPKPMADDVGALLRLTLTPKGPVVLTEQALVRP